MSPSARTLKELRKRGFQAQSVEQFNSFTKQRKDLFGIIDIIAVKKGEGTFGIQTTSGVNHTTRRIKAINTEELKEWLRSGNKFFIWSWKKGGNGRWIVREEELVIRKKENNG